MNKQEKIFLWCVRLAGIIATLLLVIFLLGLYPVMLSPKGDLFRLTSVKEFDEPFLKPYRINESVVSASPDASLVWWIGDSFSLVQFGHKPFPEQFSEKYKVPVFFSHINNFKAQGGQVLEQLKELPQEKRPKILLIECVERNLPELALFLNIEGVANRSFVPPILILLRDRLFISATSSVDFTWRRFLPVSYARTFLDTYRYKWYGDHHPLAIPHKENGLSYLEFVDDDFKNYESASIGNMVQVFSSFSKAAKELGVNVLWVIPPNRNYFFQYKNKEDFFARSLFQEMQKANLNYIDLHTPLFKARDAGESLYWKTDSHWNEKAVEISVEALEKVLQKKFGLE